VVFDEILFLLRIRVVCSALCVGKDNSVWFAGSLYRVVCRFGNWSKIVRVL